MAINSDKPASDNPAGASGGERGSGASSDGRAAGPDRAAAAEVEALVAAGRHADAAALARRSGDPGRAATLYEQIWEFSAAAECAREAGELSRALRDAIDARDEALVARMTAALEDAGDGGRRAAVQVYEAKRRFGDAAQVAEALGDRERAADLFRRGHRELDAARLLEALGRDREAGRLLEQVIAGGDVGAETARAHLRLGLLLARRMQHEQAVRHLQEAAAAADTRQRAQRALICELVALGLRDAARDVLVAARAENPSLPVDVDSLVRSERERLLGGDHPQRDEESRVIAGRYRLGKLIGAGGSGRVYRGRDEVSGRDVAVKLLATPPRRGNPAYERFAREAAIAGKLHHPNIVEVLDVAPDLGLLVMEYMAGGSLAERIGAGMPAPAVRRAALDVLAGLELAHRRGVIHRDIKPANIFFDVRGGAKLGDFGVAHLLDLGQTQTGGLIGTLAYMAPEQITGAPLTMTADLYALGVTMFEALTGRLPFLGPDFVAQHLGESAPAPSSTADNVATGWDPILARLLAKNPAERYESIDALRRALEDLDLGDAARPRPLALPRRAPARARRDSTARPAARDAEPEQQADRYQYETPIGRTPISHLGRAIDAALDRSVIVERYEHGAPDEATARRICALARGGGPYLQRALAFDHDAGVVVYEAPAGTTLSEAFRVAPPTRADAARLLKRLARAVAPVHEIGAAHGALADTTVLIDDDGYPTVLTSGLGAAPAEARPPGDVAAIVALVARMVGAQAEPEALALALTAELDAAAQAAVLARAHPRTGEELYALGDVIEIALLAQRLRASGGGSRA